LALKGKRVFISGDLYANIALYAKATNRTIEETVNDLLNLGTNSLENHMRARTILNRNE
jgi:hypothetical protein